MYDGNVIMGLGMEGGLSQVVRWDRVNVLMGMVINRQRLVNELM